MSGREPRPDASRERDVVWDRTPSGRWVALERGPKGQRTLSADPWDADAGPRPDVEGALCLGPQDDPRLTGGRLLANPSDLAIALGLESVREVRVIRYRPERRAVFLVRGWSAGREAERYVKLLRPSAYRRARDAFAALAEARPHPPVLLPDRMLDDACALVFPALEGGSYHDHLVSGRQELDEVVAGLRALEGSPSEGLPERSVEDERVSTLRMLDLGQAFMPGLESLSDAVRALVLPGPEEWGPVGLLHGDLHDRQIFFAFDRFLLIDSEGVSRGPVWIDRVNLAEHLRLRSLQGLPIAPDMAETLLRRAAVPAEQEGPRLLRGLVRARLAGVYARRPGRESLAAQLAEDARHILESAS